MPNHVYNTVTLTGNFRDLTMLKLLLNIPHECQHNHGDDSISPFNFFNLVAPDKSILDEYYGAEPTYENLEDRFKHSTNHWYDWNIRNWSTKWNAYDVSYSDTFDYDNIDDNQNNVSYGFNTAWSPPEKIIEALANKIKELKLNVTFDWFYEEEQGWGGEFYYNGDTLSVVKEWDIPASHVDYESQDKVEQCICGWSDDMDDWFEDCPRPEESK
jgi:hypothetical protein